MGTFAKVIVVSCTARFLLLWLAAQPSFISQDESVRINQIQVIGTHNSYHAGLPPGETARLRQQQPLLAQLLDYRHPPLDQQLSAGVRQIELDIFADPQGGRFAHASPLPAVAAAGPVTVRNPDPADAMQIPGFKVMHLQDLDQHSTCQTLVHCLSIVQLWSQAHRQHLPIFILLECKTARITAPSGRSSYEWMTPALFDDLEREILSVFSSAEIVTPDQVRGSHASLLQAIAHDGWPTLAVTRGKVVFLLDNLALASTYSQGHPALRGRLLFPNQNPGTPDSALSR